jgi:hypothetical protein
MDSYLILPHRKPRTQPPATCNGLSLPNRCQACNNGLANSPFHSLVFGINNLHSDELPYFAARCTSSESAESPEFCPDDGNPSVIR